jgi:hypothetical protein
MARARRRLMAAGIDLRRKRIPLRLVLAVHGSPRDWSRSPDRKQNARLVSISGCHATEPNLIRTNSTSRRAARERWNPRTGSTCVALVLSQCRAEGDCVRPGRGEPEAARRPDGSCFAQKAGYGSLPYGSGNFPHYCSSRSRAEDPRSPDQDQIVSSRLKITSSD